jgi:hypothetical protein
VRIHVADVAAHPCRVVVQERLVGSYEEGAGAAGRVEDGEVIDGVGAVAVLFQKTAESLLNDVLDGPAGRVIDAMLLAPLLLGLQSDLLGRNARECGLGGELADALGDVAKILLVDLAQNVGLHLGEVVLGIAAGYGVESLDNVCEGVIQHSAHSAQQHVDIGVGVEELAVIGVSGLSEKAQEGVGDADVGISGADAVAQATEIAAGDGAVLTVAEEDKAVYEALDGLVTLAKVGLGLPLLDLKEGVEEVLAPVAHRFVEPLLDRDDAGADAFFLGALLHQALLERGGREFVEKRVGVAVALVREVYHGAGTRAWGEVLVGVVDYQVSEVGDGGPADALVVCLGYGVGGPLGSAGVLGEAFGLEEEMGDAAELEDVVGALALGDAGLAFDVGAVMHRPAEGGEKRIDEVGADLGLLVASPVVIGEGLVFVNECPNLAKLVLGKHVRE